MVFADEAEALERRLVPNSGTEEPQAVELEELVRQGNIGSGLGPHVMRSRVFPVM